ncbi:MAG: hypothetical protein AAGI91_14770 [Bacteroidota bacterium]
MDPDQNVQLDIRIGSAGLAATDVVIDGELIVEGHEGDLSLDLGPSANLHATSVQCYTTVRGPQSDVPNRVDYGLTGGVSPWEETLVEDPPDSAIDMFFADLFLYLP